MTQTANRRRSGFTLAELMVVVALVAIAAAFALSLKQQFTRSHFFVQQMGFSADGSRLLAISTEGEAKAWDTVRGKQVGALPASPLPCAKSAVSRDGKTIARLCYKKPNFAYQDGFHLDVFDIATGQRLSRRSRDSFEELAFSPDGKWLAVWSNNSIELFNPLDSEVAKVTLPLAKSTRPKAGYWQLNTLQFGPNSNLVYVFNDHDELIRWNISSGEERRAKVMLPSAPQASSYWLAVSPEGKQLAILKHDASGTVPKLAIELRDADTLALITEKAIASDQPEIAGFAFADSGKSLVVLGDDFEFFDASSLEPTKQGKLNQAAKQIALFGGLAAGPNGNPLAISSINTIDLYENGKLRRLVDDSFSSLNFFLWLMLFNIVLMLFLYMRHRNKMKTCSQCGKKWKPMDKSLDPRCPDCRLLASSTEEVRDQQRKTKRQLIWRLLAILPLLIISPLIGRFGKASNPSDYFFTLLEAVFGMTVGVVALATIGVVIAIFVSRRKMRRLQNVERALARARKVAGSDGRIERFGPITLWTDAPGPLSETAESIAAQLENCRHRIEELTGATCPPLRPILLLAFSTSAAAQRYSPVPRIDADRNSVYLGPHADQGFFSLEISRRLMPLSVVIGGLLMHHSLKPAKKRLRLWWNLGLGTFLAVENLPSEPNGCRRKLAVWNAENSLLPLEQLFRQRLRFFFAAPSAALLPEHHERYLKIVNQCTSLVDYFCSHDSPPERRRQFAQLWQAVQQGRNMDAACQTALGYGLAQLEKEWKAWVAAAAFDPPVPAPADIANVAEKVVIPVAQDIAAPIQQRVKAIRSLGSCGWSVGIEPLQTLLNDSQPDVEREAKRALQLLCGPST